MLQPGVIGSNDVKAGQKQSVPFASSFRPLYNVIHIGSRLMLWLDLACGFMAPVTSTCSRNPVTVTVVSKPEKLFCYEPSSDRLNWRSVDLENSGTAVPIIVCQEWEISPQSGPLHRNVYLNPKTRTLQCVPYCRQLFSRNTAGLTMKGMRYKTE